MVSLHTSYPRKAQQYTVNKACREHILSKCITHVFDVNNMHTNTTQFTALDTGVNSKMVKYFRMAMIRQTVLYTSESVMIIFAEDMTQGLGY